MKRHPDDVSARVQAQKIACGPLRTAVLYRTESMKWRADDGRTIYIHIYAYIHIPYIARIAVPFMWGSLRLTPMMS